jgi:hypothetical protein
MAFLAQQAHFRTDSLIPTAAIDTSVYDVVGRYTTDGNAVACGATALPQFIFLESVTSAEVTDGLPVSVAFFGHGQLRVHIKGSVSAGQKLTTDASGYIVASATAENAALGATDFAIAREDGTDGDEILIDVLRGGA